MLGYHIIFRKQTQGGYINGFQVRKSLLSREYVALPKDIFKGHNLGWMSANTIWGCSKLAVYIGHFVYKAL